jgi:hypothetical protein
MPWSIIKGKTRMGKWKRKKTAQSYAWIARNLKGIKGVRVVRYKRMRKKRR